MRRRIFTALLSLILVIGLLPATAMAAVTTINLSGSDTSVISENKTTATTIKLTGDVELSSTLDLTDMTKLAKIDLNGYTITATGCTALKLGNNASALTIQGKTGTSHGSIVATGSDVYAIEYSGTGTLKLDIYPNITGNIKNSGDGTIQISSGKYVGTIENVGNGKILFSKTSYTDPIHTGELKNTGSSGTIALKYGKFSREPSTDFLSDQYAATKGEDGYYSVAMWTPAMAVEKGYVASRSRYIATKLPYTGKYYQTVAEAADETVALYLICDVDLSETDAGGFAFTYGKRANDPRSRELFLDGYTYTGSILDESVAKSTKYANTIIKGNTQTSKTETGRGTAKISELNTISTLNVNQNADVVVTTGKAAGINVDKTSTLTIHGGTYTGTVTVTSGGALTIDGGSFDVDVTEYCADGYIATKDASSGKYIVSSIPEEAVNSGLALAESENTGDTVGNVSETIEEEDRETAETVAESVHAELGGTAITITSAEKKAAVQQLVAAKQVKLGAGNQVVPYDDGAEVTVTIIKEPYLEVEVTELTETENCKELTLDITPKYNLLATTDPDDPQKIVTFSTDNSLTVDEDTEVTLQLPTGFANNNDKLLVKHKKNGGIMEYYTGTVSLDAEDKLFVTFTTHGFCPFTISNDIAATIGDGDDMKVFPSLQDAINSAKDGDTIKLLEDCEEPVYVNRTLKFTIDPSHGEGERYDYTIELGEFCSRNEADGTDYFDVVYTAPKSSGNGGTTNYRLIHTYVEGEGTVDPAGDIMVRDGEDKTLTFTPNAGYEIGDIVVNHKSVGAVSEYTVKDISGTVNIEVTFVKSGNAVVGTESAKNPSTGASI